jgi:hypothetical protein
MLCNIIGTNEHFGGIYCLHLEGVSVEISKYKVGVIG